MFRPKKYTLLDEAIVTCHGESYVVHRIQALIDIPRHGVKAGDLGGYVQSKKTLSHKGTCWVGGNAVAVDGDHYKGQIVYDDALVTDEAFVSARIQDSCRVGGKARILRSLWGAVSVSGNAVIDGFIEGNVTITDNVHLESGAIEAWGNAEVHISGDVVINSPSIPVGQTGNWKRFISVSKNETIVISGKLTLEKVLIRGNCTLGGEFKIKEVEFEGDNVVVGKHQIKPKVKFSGENRIKGSVTIPPGTQVHDVVMDKGVLNYATQTMVEEKPWFILPPPPSWDAMSSSPGGQENQTKSSGHHKHLAMIAEIEAEYEAYTTDIVKLIKYPAMVDTSIPEVGDFVVKLRSAKRAVRTGNVDNLPELAEVLELAFVNAENKVRTLVASHLDENKKKSLKTAEKMFNLACDEASPEPEKRLGFKAGMRELEGIIDVSDKAKDNLKARIGLLELDA